MAMSDCVKCWNTPCSCGWEYKDWDKDSRMHFAAKVLGVPVQGLILWVGDQVPAVHPLNEPKKG